MTVSTLKAAACAAVITCAAAGAQAHVVLDVREAPAGSYYKGVFRVGHGCEGSSTVSITVTVPPGILSVRPQPKTGWLISIEKEPLGEAAHHHHHGHAVTERVARVTWTGGPLPDAYFDEFALQMKLPETAPDGVLHFPVLQKCEKGERDWAEIPVAGMTIRDVKSPAAALRLTPKR